MNTIFRHPNLTIRESPGKGFGVKSTDTIQAGTILLIEHVMVGDLNDLTTFVLTQPRLLSSLSPRESLPSDLSDLRKVIFRKLIANCVGAFDTDLSILAKNFNFFNHSCHPNAHWAMGNETSIPDIMFKTIYIYAKDIIAPDTEITITYNSNVGHEVGNFKCDCGQSLIERIKNLEINRKKCSDDRMCDHVSAYLKPYYGTLTEFLNTYRQNESLFQRGSKLPKKIKQLNLLNKLSGTCSQTVFIKAVKHIDKINDKPVSSKDYIRIAQCSFAIVQKEGLAWV